MGTSNMARHIFAGGAKKDPSQSDINGFLKTNKIPLQAKCYKEALVGNLFL